MQNKSRFGELHNVCFNEENYPYDIFKFLEIFRNCQSRVTVTRNYLIDTIPNDFLEYQNISNEAKQLFERNISPIQSKDFNGITTAFFSNSIIGNWYLKEIDKNSIVGYHNGIPDSNEWLWSESTYSLKYEESEIVYCIMKKLSKYYDQDKRFEIEFNKYKGFFDGTLEEFLDCLINQYENFKFYYSSAGWYYMNKIEGYDGLRRKLTEIMNNLPNSDQVEDGKTVDKKTKEDDISWRSKALFMLYRKKVDANFSYQDTLVYFKCTDTKKYKPNYKQLHTAYLFIEDVKDRCSKTYRKDILRTIQELEKLESCKKSLEFARAECNDFNVNYPIQ